MAPFPVDPSGGDGQGCARLGAGGTPALPGSRHPMTSSLQGHHIAEALWRRLWLKEVHLFFLPVYLCLFVSICGSSSLTISRFSSNDPHGSGGGRARGQTGVSQRVRVGFLRSRPPDAPHRISLRLEARLLRLPLKGGVIALGARASRPHPVPYHPGARASARMLSLWPPLSFSAMLQAATLSGREQHRPGRRRAMAPFPVDPSGGDGRGCARLGAGGTPALPGSLHPMTSSHQGHQIAEAFWRRLWLKEVHLSFWSICVYWCPFVVHLH